MGMKRTHVDIRTRRIRGKGLDIIYPQVVDVGDRRVRERINREIYKTVRDMIRDQGEYLEMVGNYEIKTNQRDILSLTLTNYAFAGGAHGNTIVRGLTFDLKTGDLYTLADLFQVGSPYREVLSEEVRQQIEVREIPLIEDFELIRANQDFYIGDKALVLFFQLYQLAPYVYGILDFPISVYGIEGIIPEDGLLQRMIGAYIY
ncbi:DUF3298 and DUF4163 domain-containing protein [Halonatronum saccharophilum]|uniref:DUF3298 and DUF4163 domain-containing protein n=1 Tax=Halonatronum saccharophilum TaxID=150060 RepID=UPI000485AB9D|nr:DUF3298 and DUF4163 domain-containing protein [Halonatronum saccharophilum]